MLICCSYNNEFCPVAYVLLQLKDERYFACPRVSELGAPMNVMATAISSTAIMVTWTHPMFMNTIDDYFVVWEQFGLPSGVLKEGGAEEILCESFNTHARKRSVSPHMVRRKRSRFPFCTEFTRFNITGLEEYINYTVSVIASNNAGDGTRGFDTALTMPAGVCIRTYVFRTNILYTIIVL